VSRSLRLAVAALATIVIASSAAVAFELAAQPLAIASLAPVATDAATATPVGLGSGPAPAVSEARTVPPAATCRVLPTPERIEPPHAPVNGQPSLGVPTLPGVILVQIPQCRDIKQILSRYGLPGPATRYLDVLESDEMIANGATRWFRVAVTPGTESATVVELYRHPEDIEYVQLIPEFTGGAAAAPVRAEDVVPSAFCGTVNALVPATETTDGSITIGTHLLILRADALYSRVGQNADALKVGRQICLYGSLSSGAFTQYLGIAMPSPLCGSVVAYTEPSTIEPGLVALRDLGTALLRVSTTATLGVVAVGSRVCVNLMVDRTGDAIVASRSLTLAERTAAIVSVCGMVWAWIAPERGAGATLVHRTADWIIVGSHTYPIARGTVYSLINAPPIVGQPTCLSGNLDASGALIQYAAHPGLPSCTSGRIERYLAPTRATDGEVRFAVTTGPPATPESYRFRIPAGTDLPVNVGNGAYCFTLALDGRGDAVVSGTRVPEPPRGAT
jgi:hypothetical protein